jgi:hypothetical protein
MVDQQYQDIRYVQYEYGFLGGVVVMRLRHFWFGFCMAR